MRFVKQSLKLILRLNAIFIRQKDCIQFIPSEIAKQLVNLAKIDEHSKVLEPSAGIGSIADSISKVTKNIDVCEYNYSFSELLKLKGYNVVGNDFLEYNSEPIYDAIIMNPPFSNNQDIEHLQHAYSILKTGGILFCITSPHWFFASDNTTEIIKGGKFYKLENKMGNSSYKKFYNSLSGLRNSK